MADDGRKLRMREELLGHAVESFAEVRADAADDGGAIDRALARFGPPAELTPQLQATVPWFERLHVRLLGYRWDRNESFVRFAARQLLTIAPIALPLPAILASRHRVGVARHCGV